MEGFERRTFSARLRDRRELIHDVYSRGDGPPIIVIQELPGIGPETLALADRLVASGFRVVMPHLFGPLGQTSMVGNLGRVMCMRREFRVFAHDETSPVVDWLRALAADVAAETSAPGVGVIGMCLTGNFAISMMVDESVLAAVASQPSMPFGSQASLHMSEVDVEAARRRLDAHGPMLAFRFEGDHLCAAKKFAAIDRKFNDDRERVRLETLPGRGHSVLTIDFVDEEGHPTQAAMARVLDYFHDKLDEAQA